MLKQLLITKGPTETQLVRFSFNNQLAVGENLTGTPTVAISVYSGVDANYGAMLDGSATIDGQDVTQLIQFGEEGVTYELVANCGTTLSQTLQVAAFLSVIGALG